MQSVSVKKYKFMRAFMCQSCWVGKWTRQRTYHDSDATVSSSKINSDDITDIGTLVTSGCNISDPIEHRNLLGLAGEQRALDS